MPTRLSETPNGTLVQQDDGSVVLVPSEVADQMAPGAPAPPGTGGPPPQALGAGSPITDVQSPGIAPPPIASQPEPQQTKPMGPGPVTPEAPPPMPADEGPVSSPLQVDPSLAGPAGQSSAASPSPEQPQPTDPFEQEAASHILAGNAADAKAQDDARILTERNQRLDAMRVDAEKLAAKNEARRAEMASQYEAATKAYAEHKIHEPEPGWGQIFAWVLGGLGQTLNKSDHNVVIDQWERMTAENIRRQEADRARLGNLADRAGADLDKFVAHAKDSESAFAAKMAGEAERFAQFLEVGAAKAGGQKEKARALAAAADARQRGQAYQDAAVERDWQHGKAQADFELDKFKAQEAVAARKAQIGATYAGIASQERIANRGLDIKEREMMMDAEKLARSGDVEGAKLKLAEAKEVRELGIGAGTQLAARSDGKPVANDAGLLLNKDGSVYKAPTTAAAEKLRPLVASTVTSANLIDDLLRMRNAHGWKSDTFRSPEFLAAKSTYDSLVLEGKTTGQLGVLAGPDMDILKNIFGGDPTQIRDPSAALKTARANVIRKTQRELETNQYTGTFDVVDKSAPEAAPRNENTEAGVSRGGAKTGFGEVERTPGNPFGVGQAMTEEQRQGIAGASYRATKGDSLGFEELATIAFTAPNPQARAAATAALINLKKTGSAEADRVLRERLGEFGYKALNQTGSIGQGRPAGWGE